MNNTFVIDKHDEDDHENDHEIIPINIDEASNFSNILKLYSDKFANTDKTLNFWKKYMKIYCESCNELYIEEKHMAEKFIIDGVYPSSLQPCLDLLVDSGYLLDMSKLKNFLKEAQNSIYSVSISNILNSSSLETNIIEENKEDEAPSLFSSLFSSITTIISNKFSISGTKEDDSYFISPSGEKVKRYLPLIIFDEAIKEIMSYIEKHGLDEDDRVLLIRSLSSMKLNKNNENLEDQEEIIELIDENNEYSNELKTFKEFINLKIIKKNKNIKRKFSIILSSSYYIEIFLSYLCYKQIILIKNSIILFLTSSPSNNILKENISFIFSSFYHLSSKEEIEVGSNNKNKKLTLENDLNNIYYYYIGKYQIYNTLIKINYNLIRLKKLYKQYNQKIKKIYLKNYDNSSIATELKNNYKPLFNTLNKEDQEKILYNLKYIKQIKQQINQNNNIKINFFSLLNNIHESYTNYSNVTTLKLVHDTIKSSNKNLFHTLTNNQYKANNNSSILSYFTTSSNSSSPNIDYHDITLEKIDEIIQDYNDENEKVQEISNIYLNYGENLVNNNSKIDSDELEKELEELNNLIKQEEIEQLNSSFNSKIHTSKESSDSFSFKELEESLPDVLTSKVKFINKDEEVEDKKIEILN